MTILPALQRCIGGFVRRTWLVTLVAVLVCAVFAAQAVAAYVEADHLIVQPHAAPPPKLQPIRSPSPARDPNVLSERNIFCSTCTPTGEPGSSNAYTGHPAILIATMLGTAPRATVRVIPTDAQGSWGLDEIIPGVGRVTRIGAGSIDVLDDDNHMKQLSLFDVATGTGAATPAAGPAAAATTADPFAGRIKKLSDGSYEVDRNVVRELVAMGGQNTGVRAYPVMAGNEVKGLRLAGVRPNSIAAALGLRTSDVLSAIDGDPIKTMNQMLDLYSKLDKLNGIELQGTRAGKPLAVSLRFR